MKSAKYLFYQEEYRRTFNKIVCPDNFEPAWHRLDDVFNHLGMTEIELHGISGPSYTVAGCR